MELPIALALATAEPLTEARRAPVRTYFHLIELVQPVKPSHVFSVRIGLAPEARCKGRESLREILFV